MTFLLSGIIGMAQTDSLIMTNKDVMVGEIKSLDKGVLFVKTGYSENDFKIKWSEIKEVYSSTRFLITLRDGQRINGNLMTNTEGNIFLLDEDGVPVATTMDDIVHLIGLKSELWSRVNANMDLGFSFTKANHLKQGTMSLGAGYLGDSWSTDIFFNLFRSVQDSIAATRRNEAGINYKYYLQHDWYLMLDGNYLSNTEQALNARYTGKAGAGKFLTHSNQSYLGVGGGISLNIENFSNEAPDRSSAEAYFGAELNMFDTGDLSLLSNIYLYPSLTESGRIRSDFKVDTKYEFANDFYVKFNLTLNYDNRPAVAGNESDYVYGISLGWEL
ncbi:MAG: DUF481 domain-containing protein [Saprospiraceae bacterium]|nr:DUF481 domain-containing protein [Candidatus Opimibacter iunctus]